MLIREWLERAKGLIDPLDAELIALVCFAPEGADRSWLVTHDVVKITTEVAEKAEKMLKRRQDGEPLAYTLGFREFYGRKFAVDTRVLIPRPETEQLVEMALEVLDGQFETRALSEQGLDEKGLKETLSGQKRPKVLEIGTGGGCIAVTLKLERPEIEMVAVDLSQDALEVAQENARRLGAEIGLLYSDLLANVSETGDFDLILANLPYVSRDWEWVKSENLRYEPDSALYAGEKGLALYRELFEQMARKWPLGGQKRPVLILEADPCQHDALAKMAQKQGWNLRQSRGYALLFVAA